VPIGASFLRLSTSRGILAEKFPQGFDLPELKSPAALDIHTATGKGFRSPLGVRHNAKPDKQRWAPGRCRN